MIQLTWTDGQKFIEFIKFTEFIKFIVTTWLPSSALCKCGCLLPRNSHGLLDHRRLTLYENDKKKQVQLLTSSQTYQQTDQKEWFGGEKCFAFIQRNSGQKNIRLPTKFLSHQIPSLHIIGFLTPITTTSGRRCVWGMEQGDTYSLFSYVDSINKCPSWKKDGAMVCYHLPANDTVEQT